MTDRGRPRLLANRDLVRTRLLRRAGFTTEEIAEHFKVSVRTVRRRLREPYKQPERRW